MSSSDVGQASSSAPGIDNLVYPEYLGFPGDFNIKGNLLLTDETATLCGHMLNHEGLHSGVKDTVIGGVIYAGNNAYAMTSARSHEKASCLYQVEHQSKINLDWALLIILRPLELPNVNGSTRLIHYKKDEELPEITGTVKVLAGRGKEFEAHLSMSDDWMLAAFPRVKLVGLITTLPKETTVPRGAWVVQADTVCGYVVHCEPGTNGRVGFMAPIEPALKEMKKRLKGEPLFPEAPLWVV